jgi:hypothetical protein
MTMLAQHARLMKAGTDGADALQSKACDMSVEGYNSSSHFPLEHIKFPD